MNHHLFLVCSAVVSAELKVFRFKVDILLRPTWFTFDLFLFKPSEPETVRFIGKFKNINSTQAQSQLGPSVAVSWSGPWSTIQMFGFWKHDYLFIYFIICF